MRSRGRNRLLPARATAAESRPPSCPAGRRHHDAAVILVSLLLLAAASSDGDRKAGAVHISTSNFTQKAGYPHQASSAHKTRTGNIGSSMLAVTVWMISRDARPSRIGRQAHSEPGVVLAPRVAPVSRCWRRSPGILVHLKLKSGSVRIKGQQPLD
jgi:hypothetical protein